MAGVEMTPAQATESAGASCAVSQLAADPLARLARVAPDEQAVRVGRARQGTHERGPQPSHGRRIERRRTGVPAHAICPEESFGHECRNPVA